METSIQNVDVLIVGAGSVGLSLAAELTRVGVSTSIVDRQAAGANTSRACVIHARTLEELEPLGVTSQLLDKGVKVPLFRIRERDRSLITIDFAEIGGAFPFTIMYPQDGTERLLLATLERLGGHVQRPVELKGFACDASRVVATLETPGQRKALRSRWLVGCDGSHSLVRTQSKIAFEGAAYEQSFILADVRMRWPLSREEVTLFYSPNGLMVVAPLPDEHFRIVATHAAAPENPSATDIQALLDARGPTVNPARLHELVSSSRFRIQHRVASTLRKGRILLCGDAAHVHSPAGGQGMNTGIQDAMSLADALLHTLRDGDESRLDAWASERHRVATQVVALTDRMTRVATMKSPLAQSLRNASIAFAGHFPPVRTSIARRLAELDAHF